jgi:hypothetical protein
MTGRKEPALRLFRNGESIQRAGADKPDAEFVSSLDEMSHCCLRRTTGADFGVLVKPAAPF